VPDHIYEQLVVPSLDKIDFKKIKQFYSYDNTESIAGDHIEPHFDPIDNDFAGFGNLKHLQMQVDHLDATNFVQLCALIDTNALDTELRVYLQLLTSLLFELPLAASDGSIMSREQVILELNRDLLEFGSSLGINGADFEPGSFSQYLSVFVKAPIANYKQALVWLKRILFDSVFDAKQIQTACSNLLKDIKRRKQQPFDLIQSLTNDLCFIQSTKIYFLFFFSSLLFNFNA
jgi:Zn-dependent M16 (insulinase) family peptidase